MFPFPSADYVNLCATRGQGSYVAPHSEQDYLSDVAEIEADSSAIRAAIFPDLVPDEVRFVLEPPSFHDFKALQDKGVRDPEIEVTLWQDELRDRQLKNLIVGHRSISQEALMLRSHLPRAVHKPPRRIGQYRRVLVFAESEEVFGGRKFGPRHLVTNPLDRASELCQKPGSGNRLRYHHQFSEGACSCVSWTRRRTFPFPIHQRGPAVHRTA